jgi:CheY-like chemotaxis protein/anti-sigma regulatory factor (Ser/Thr protein kinase)
VAQAREVSLRWQPQATAALWVLADPVRVRQVVINLLSNAIKYNRPGGHVTLHAQAEGDRVVIDVRDSGVGMSPLQQERLFRRFDRLGRDDGDVQGLGIGLALTRELVQAMQGEMLVDSVEGAGTSVRVALPAALAPAAIPAPSATRRADEAPRGDAVLRGRVLYIEDEPVNRLLLQSWAERHPDLRIDCADTGLAGLCEAEASAPDLVLMDLGLPDIEGLQLLRRLIELPALQRVPVVVLSANALPADVEAALAAGARAYWTKPIDFDRFTTQLATLLPLTADATG